MKVRYFLKSAASHHRWVEVTKSEWVDAERGAGFRNTWGRDSEPATGGFGNGSVQGTVTYGDRVPEGFEEAPQEPLRELAEWLVTLDDPDPASQGFQDRRTTTMTQIIERARKALDVQR